MMLAEIIVYTVGIYLAAGTLFALYFVIFGITKLDDAARSTGLFFRFLIFFGAVPFWVILAWRIFGGNKRPPENNAHRRKMREVQ